MRAALYLRRSTDEQADSLDTQEDLGRRFAAARGLTITARYTDTASGAEWAADRRPDLWRLLTDARGRAFDVLVIRDESRLGRDTLRLPLYLSDLADAGVRVLCYATGEALAVDTPTAQLVTTIRSYAAAQERAAIASRTRDALERRARAGLVAGGECYGYTRERRADGVHLVICEPEATLVRRIFRDAGAGQGVRGIAHALNAEGVPPPRAGSRGWAPSCIHAILHRERYLGRLTWGATAKGYRGGTKVRTDSPERVLTVERPELAIITAEQWAAVHDRRAAVERTTTTRRTGTAPSGLLVGVARCGGCGGPLAVLRTKIGRETVAAYACSYHHARGSAVCPVRTRRPLAEVEAAVVAALGESLARLRGAVVEALRRLLDVRPAAEDRSGLERAAEDARRRVARLVRAIAASDEPPDALVVELRAAERRAREAAAALAAASAPVLSLDAAMEAERLYDLHVAELAGGLVRAPGEAREALRALLDGPIVARPVDTADGPRWDLRGACRSVCVPSGEWTDPWSAVA